MVPFSNKNNLTFFFGEKDFEKRNQQKKKETIKSLIDHTKKSGVAQRKRVGPITQRSEDRNLLPLNAVTNCCCKQYKNKLYFHTAIQFFFIIKNQNMKIANQT